MHLLDKARLQFSMLAINKFAGGLYIILLT